MFGRFSKLTKRVKIGIGLVSIATLLLLLPYIIPIPAAEFASPLDIPGLQGEILNIDGYLTHVLDLPKDGADLESINTKSTIVLVHGFGGGVHNWEYTIPALTQAGYRVVALDLIGFGASAKGAEYNHSHKAQAELINGVLASKQIEQVHIVGHSMGGNVATMFTMLYPEKVVSLTIVDGAIVDSSYLALGQLLNFGPFAKWGEVILSYLIGSDTISAALNSAYVNKQPLNQEKIDSYKLALRMQNWQQSLLALVRDSADSSLPKAISTIELPVQIIWGELDAWISLQVGQELNNHIANSKLKIISGVGHLPMEEAPQQFNAALLDFLSAVTSQ